MSDQALVDKIRDVHLKEGGALYWEIKKILSRHPSMGPEEIEEWMALPAINVLRKKQHKSSDQDMARAVISTVGFLASRSAQRDTPMGAPPPFKVLHESGLPAPDRVAEAFAVLSGHGVSLYLTRDAVSMQGERPLQSDVLTRIAREEVAFIERLVRRFPGVDKFVETLDRLGYDARIGFSAKDGSPPSIDLEPVDRREFERAPGQLALEL